ncbi:DUF1007 family protein [Methylobacterium sp. Leaf117]|uniref:DUF1007 family protein n=1 Tax=Methylobacterium sp. Leaf117 TaxID=1736260 RepID=UPI0006F668EB|nr:DUF1007 family protein [Methylobacterium sp. Leaf117]KQP88056.1 ABC transporter substrate-binding protein [Methylobacterium sp. Leaf117]
MPIASPFRLLTLCGLTLAASSLATPSLAHPHVWVTTKAEIAYGEGGRVTGIRHAWSFDASYSAFVTQGLDANKDGKLTPDELAGLAAENTANLAEFAYFTKMKVGGKEQAFADPIEPRMVMEGDKLTLSFLLPLKTPVAQGRGVTALEVYDPTFFVSFALAEGSDAARLAGAPAGCAATVTRPKTDPGADGRSVDGKTADAKPGMSEAFFEALTSASNYGLQFANRVIVACP